MIAFYPMQENPPLTHSHHMRPLLNVSREVLPKSRHGRQIEPPPSSTALDADAALRQRHVTVARSSPPPSSTASHSRKFGATRRASTPFTTTRRTCPSSAVVPRTHSRPSWFVMT